MSTRCVICDAHLDVFVNKDGTLNKHCSLCRNEMDKNSEFYKWYFEEGHDEDAPTLPRLR
jgi:hypothetical protein